MNDQWWLCFRFKDGHAYAVEIVDYHSLRERYWINLQSWYDLEFEKDRVGNRLKKEVTTRAA